MTHSWSTSKLDRRERSHQLMRDDVLAAAREILLRDGIAGLSMRALGRAVGVTAPTLYDYFPSKQAVLDALFGEGVEKLAGAMEAAVRDATPGRARILAICHAYRNVALSDPDLFRLVMGRVDANYCVEEPMLLKVARLGDLPATVVNEAISAGDIAIQDPDVARVLLWSTLHGWVTLEMEGHIAHALEMNPDVAFTQAFDELLDRMAS